MVTSPKYVGCFWNLDRWTRESAAIALPVSKERKQKLAGLARSRPALFAAMTAAFY
jgi:hypothetical protein